MLIFARFSALLIGVLCAMPGLSAQTWKQIISTHFDVYYPAGEDEAARLVAELAEQAYVEMGKSYDIRPSNRGRILFRTNATTAQQTLHQLPSGAGAVPLADAVVIHPGTRLGLTARVREAVSALLLHELSYSNGALPMLYERNTYFMPVWYTQPLASYLAWGWTYEDDIRLAALDRRSLPALAQFDTTAVGDLARRSIWHFVATQYGSAKLAEVAYLASISSSVESGLQAVLGLNAPRFTASWREFLAKYTESVGLLRLSPGQAEGLEEMKLPEGWMPVSFATHPQSLQVAVVAANTSKTSIFTRSEDSRFWQSAEIGGNRLALPTLLPGCAEGLPLAWHPRGTLLASVRYRDDATAEIVIISPGNEKAALVALPQDYDRVLHLRWSPDGKRLVGTVLRKGQTDLFVCNATGGGFKLLTNDPADDGWPVWNEDGDRLLFSSTRDTAGKATNLGWDLWVGSPNEARFAPEHLRSTPYINETHPAYINPIEISYITDGSGVPNLASYHLAAQTEHWLTDLATGMLDGEVAGTNAAFLMPSGRGSSFCMLPLTQAGGKSKPTLSPLRIAALLRETPRQEAALQPTSTQPTASAAVSTPAATDSATAPPSRQPVRYYVFDEDDAPYVAKPQQQANQTSSQAPPIFSGPAGAATPQEEIVFSAPMPATAAWEITHANLAWMYQPAVQASGLDLQFRATDMLHGRQFAVQMRPYFSFRTLSLRSWDANASLSIRKSAWTHTWQGSGHSLHTLFYPQEQLDDRETEAFRFLQGKFQYSLTRQLLPGLTAGAETSLGWQSKTPLALANSNLTSDAGSSASLYTTVRYDRTQKRNNHIASGTFAQLRTGVVAATGTASGLAFGEIRLTARNYQPIGNRIVFATQFQAGLSGLGQGKTYYLGGGPDQILLMQGLSTFSLVPGRLDTTLYGFSFHEFLPAVHGTPYATRRGSRILTLNAELRIPLLDAGQSLSTQNPLRLEVIPFFDAGTAWVSGNPFSQSNPTDSRLIEVYPVTINLQTLSSPFVFAGGLGLRALVYGMSLRSDLAWSYENETLNSARFSLSVGKDF